MKIFKISTSFVWACSVLVVLACGIPSLSAPTPTTTLPTEVDSPYKADLLGQWKIVNGGDWEGAILTFNDDGTFSVTGGSQKKNDKGTFFFTAEKTISFSFPDYQGSTEIDFQGNDNMSLSVTTSDDVFGLLYSAERVK